MHEDYQSDNKSHKSVDTVSAKVTNVLIYGLGRSFLFTASQKFEISTSHCDRTLTSEQKINCTTSVISKNTREHLDYQPATTYNG